MSFFKKKSNNKPVKRYHSPPEVEDRKQRAARRNQEAQERLQRALKKLGPINDVSDLLGEAR